MARCSDVKQRFGLAIKNWRTKSGLLQEELAGRAGLHRTYLSDIERGIRNASLQSIEKLANALQVSISALFDPPPVADSGSKQLMPGAPRLRKHDKPG